MNAMPKPKPRTIAGTLDRLCGDAKRLCANEHLMAARRLRPVEPTPS